MTEDIITFLESHGIRPTANRITIARFLLKATSPMSLSQMQEELETIDKSSIFRVLTLMLEHNAVHAVEDGRGVVKYELCRDSGNTGNHGDYHVHFYCNRCQSVTCFENIPTPHLDIPVGYRPQSVNFMIKGLCPDCAKLD